MLDALQCHWEALVDAEEPDVGEDVDYLKRVHTRIKNAMYQKKLAAGAGS